MSLRFRHLATEPEVLVYHGPKQQVRSNRFAKLDFHPTGRGPITPSKRFAKLDFRDLKPKKPEIRRSKRFDRIAWSLWPKQVEEQQRRYEYRRWHVSVYGTTANSYTVQWSTTNTGASNTSINVWIYDPGAGRFSGRWVIPEAS